MKYTFNLNTNDFTATKNTVKKFCEENDITITDEQIEKLSSQIHNSSNFYISVKAKEDDLAWENLEEEINTEVLQDYLEIADVDDSDEYEREERARARYEAELEDRAMEEYYERKYGGA